MTKKIIGFVILLCGVGMAVYFLWPSKPTDQPKGNTNQEIYNNVIPSVNLPVGSVNTVNWKAYRNQDYNVELKYPQNWTVSSVSNSGADFVLLNTMVQFTGYSNIDELTKSYFYQTVENSPEILESKNIKNIDELYLYYKTLLDKGSYLGLNIIGIARIYGQKVYVLNYFGETQTDYVIVYQHTDGKIVVIDFRPEISEDVRNSMLNTLHFIKN